MEAVERVAGEKSELAELWDDADDPEWRESFENLAERLHRAAVESPAASRASHTKKGGP